MVTLDMVLRNQKKIYETFFYYFDVPSFYAKLRDRVGE